MTAPLGLWLSCTGGTLWLLILCVWIYTRLHNVEWSPREGRFLRDATLASVGMVIGGAALAAGGW